MYPLPKKYYLTVHDAIRKALGNDAAISAFVTSRGAFQCDMLVNSATTDPDTGATPHEFALRLQQCIGTCDIAVRRQRLDITFMDREVLRLALGAPSRAMNNLRSTTEINEEPEWSRRNRLRISLGYDEDLFLSECDLKMCLAGRIMEKWVFDTYFDASRESKAEFMRRCNPPVAYWLAHAYSLAREYRVDHHVTIAGTISHTFAKYYGEFPFDNPYCPGEDLNTMACVQWLCRAWKQIPIEYEEGAEHELQLGVGLKDEMDEGNRNQK